MPLTSTTPTPLTWTMRLKNHKTTVILHVDSLQSLSTLKKELLAVLNEISPSGLNGHALPSSTSDMLLAKPIDPLDMSFGWDALERSNQLDDPFNIDEDAPKGKGKQLESENLKAYGIKDNAVLAFKFRGDGTKGWDVVQATFEDEYGVANEGDMGVVKEFKG